MRKRLLVGGAIVVALALVAALLVGLHVWRSQHRTTLEKALGLAPKDGQRYAWTDWAAVRSDVAAAKASASAAAHDGDTTAPPAPDSDPSDLDEDVTSSSALAGSTGAFAKAYGLSLDQVEWELLVGRPLAAGSSQVDLVGFSDAVSADTIRDALTAAGFSVPHAGDGVWDGDGTPVATSDPVLGHAAIDASDHVLLLSDDAGYLARTVAGLHSSSDLPDGIAQAASAIGSPVAAELFSGPYVCNALAISQSDPSSQATGDALIASAGEIDPVRGFALGVRDDGVVQVAMTFADHDQARANADSRSRLAVGPAAGQSEGDFTDMFSLGTVTADNDVVTMELHPVEDQLYSDLLSGGPILFATC